MGGKIEVPPFKSVRIPVLGAGRAGSAGICQTIIFFEGDSCVGMVLLSFLVARRSPVGGDAHAGYREAVPRPDPAVLHLRGVLGVGVWVVWSAWLWRLRAVWAPGHSSFVMRSQHFHATL